VSGLAAVVVAWNGREDVLAALAALAPQLGPADRVLVVDNASTDGTAAAVRRAHPSAEVIDAGANLGFAGGAAAGIRRALDLGLPWVLLLNQDAAPEPGAVAALLADGGANPSAGAIQPLVLSAADPGRVDTLGIRVFRGLRARDAGSGSRAAAAPTEPRPVFGACAAAVLLRSEALRAAGLPDPELFLLFEDVDLAFRLRAAGWEARLAPAARVRHPRGISGAGPRPSREGRRRRFFLHRNITALALRYWPLRWLLPSAPLLAWLMLDALRLAPAAPGHRCVPLWRRYLAGRRASRRALADRGADRWFE
jgi:GT2 family glycosyltransferase